MGCNVDYGQVCVCTQCYNDSLLTYTRADDTDVYTGKAKGPSVPRATYNAAQKMRAAISHKFGRDFGLHTQSWQESTTQPGKYTGNPSLSSTICHYMISLRRRKVSTCAFISISILIQWG